MKKAFGICGLLALGALRVDARDPLTIDVSPAHSFAPSQLVVRARIDPNAANRSVTFIADGDSYYRSSEMSLAGAGAPKVIEMPFPNVPGGQYEMYAVLADTSGRERAVAHRSVTVFSVGGEF